jgi:phage N-6-adenine-methyltransferase
MTVDKALFSSDSDEWGTPQDLFDVLNTEFRFTLDVAASDDNHKCERYFTQATDGLKQSWSNERCWLNCPYSGCADWMAKAYAESQAGALVVCLIPSRTDTRYWHEFVMQASQIRFIKGRLKFEMPGQPKSNSAPFPSAIVVFGGVKSWPNAIGWDYRATGQTQLKLAI